MSESEDYEYYAYSSDEDGYPLDEDTDWDTTPTDGNPNAPPSTSSSAPNTTKAGIRIMAAEDLRPEMMRRVKDASEVLGIRTAAAAVLLRAYHWSKEALLEAYMNDSDSVLKEHGVYHRCGHDIKPKQADLDICKICYEENPDTVLSMPCGHAFCYDCWYDFCVNAISEGPSCVNTTCPDASCQEIVTEEEVKAALAGESGDDDDGKEDGDAMDVASKDGSKADAGSALTTGGPLQKFYTYQLRSYVESNPLSRWCPGRGCERVACALSPAMMEAEGNVAHCDSCATSFCLVCGEPPHAPSSCKDLALWNEKCRNESETANWILANTKSCPKCVSRIEKNQGCNHMTCQRCKYEFCWICMGDWKHHGANTGGYYKCSRYQEENAGPDDGDQSDSAKAKRDLDRYLHYYRRYHAHQEAEKFAMKQLKETESRMVQLQESSGDAKWSDVEFLKTANEQLVECRRVLKYTYVFAYYLDPRQSMQRERFEHHQEMLERFTENLSELSEKPLSEMDRTDVVNQTRVVDRFMKNILKYVDDGMEE